MYHTSYEHENEITHNIGHKKCKYSTQENIQIELSLINHAYASLWFRIMQKLN